MNNCESQYAHPEHIALELRFLSTSRSGRHLALDCGMVGTGRDGQKSSLARVSLVNFHGVVQLDEYVLQQEPVVNYRTWISGIRESDLIGGM
jgi:RNA exonuclease 4